MLDQVSRPLHGGLYVDFISVHTNYDLTMSLLVNLVSRAYVERVSQASQQDKNSIDFAS
jgi:hypothetical protein